MRIPIVLTFLISFSSLAAQERQKTFEVAEEPISSISSSRDIHFVGLSYSLLAGSIFDVEFEFFPLTIGMLYEYDYLLLPNHDRLNVALTTSPQIMYPWGYRLPFGLDLRVGNMASKNAPSGSRGIFFGAGYEQKGFFYSWLDADSGAPYLRGGIAIEQLSMTYLHSTITFDGQVEYFGNVSLNYRLAY